VTEPVIIGGARKRAWETRRRKYGPKGHGSSYSRTQGACASCQRMTDLIVRLHVEEVLSEGQAARATGLHRIDLRKLADDVINTPSRINDDYTPERMLLVLALKDLVEAVYSGGFPHRAVARAEAMLEKYTPAKAEQGVCESADPCTHGAQT
jgi:hypothetical protein